MADELLCFATLVSMAILAAGSTWPEPEVIAPPLQETVGADNKQECVYTDYVETGSMQRAGTDAAVTLTVATANGTYVFIENLERWGGVMGKGHNYFEAGSVDVFTGRGRCLPSPPCLMVIRTDGGGWFPGWYCKSVEVTATGPTGGCARAEFAVEQWMARDEPPYKLFAMRSVCDKNISLVGGEGTC